MRAKILCCVHTPRQTTHICEQNSRYILSYLYHTRKLFNLSISLCDSHIRHKFADLMRWRYGGQAAHYKTKYYLSAIFQAPVQEASQRPMQIVLRFGRRLSQKNWFFVGG